MNGISWDDGVAIIRPYVNGKQRNLRWGKVSKAAANTAAEHVEALNLAVSSGSPPNAATQKWVNGLGLKLHKKLANIGLTPSREEETRKYLKEFLEAYIGSRKNLKPYSIRNLVSSMNQLTKFFGDRCPLDKINSGRAEDWEQTLWEKYAEATIAGFIKDAKQFFSYAVKRKFITENPFDELKPGSQSNDARLQYIDVPTITKVLAEAGDNEWKCVIALCRFLGLRCPSEVLDLTWNDVDFVSNRVTIRNHKTGDRTLPLFVEVRPYLQALFDERNIGIDAPLSQPVIMRYREENANLRTRLHRNIKRAGVEIWQRAFHNMRASRVIEAADNFPSHVCAKWFGHSEVIAMQHYLKVTQAHYERAIAGPVTLTSAVVELLKQREPVKAQK